MNRFKIGKTGVGEGHPCFIIAELSANHGGKIEIAIETVEAAARAGADAIKLQTFTPDTITLDSEKEDFKIRQGTIWDGQYLHELYKTCSLPWDWHKNIFDAANRLGMACFSSPFDPTAVDFLEDLHAPAFKIASYEITDIPLIEYVAAKGKPVILSTGIAELEDIELALDACTRMGNHQIGLLKCTSSYPAPINEANLALIKDMAEKFGVVTGLSDHTLGATVPITSVALGAKIIEKHFILDRSVGGPDASFSMDESEFTEMVKAVRQAESAIGTADYTVTEKQKSGRDFSRSLYVVSPIKKGEAFTNENVRSIRPGFGLHPKHLPDILGKIANQDLEKGTRFDLNFVAK